MSTVVDLATLRPVIGAEPTPAEILADARHQAEQIIDDARDEAGRILDGAQRAVEEADGAVAAAEEKRQLHERQAIRARELADTETEGAAEIVGKARAQAAELLDQAAELASRRRTSAEEAYSKALTDAEEIRSRAHARAEELLEQARTAEAEAETIRAAAETEAELARRKAHLDLDEETAARRTEIRHDLDQAREAAEELRTEIQEKFRALGAQHMAEYEEQRDRLDAELADMRRKAGAEAKSTVDKAAREAEGIRKAAERDAATATGRATAREAAAEKLFVRAEAAARRTSRRMGWTRKFWTGAPWIALAAGVGLAASGEYELARLVGINPYVAPLLPVSIDVYAVSAFRAKRDIAPALLLMAGANLAFHIADQAGIGHGGKATPWQLTAAVVLIFVAVIWRVHALLGHHGEESTVRTDEADSARTDGRTDEPRTEPRTPRPRTGRTAIRTDKHRTARTDGGRTANAAPVRTDAEAVAIVRTLTPETDGFVNVNAVRTAVGCNRDRAVRLLAEAGLLRPADAAKHLTP